MSDRAVGFAIMHWRAVRPLRRVHQDIRRTFTREPLVTAGGGVTLNAPAPGLAETGSIEEVPDCENTLGPHCKTAVTGDAGIACVRPKLRRKCQCYIEPVGR